MLRIILIKSVKYSLMLIDIFKKYKTSNIKSKNKKKVEVIK